MNSLNKIKSTILTLEIEEVLIRASLDLFFFFNPTGGCPSLPNGGPTESKNTPTSPQTPSGLGNCCQFLVAAQWEGLVLLPMDQETGVSSLGRPLPYLPQKEPL